MSDEITVEATGLVYENERPDIGRVHVQQPSLMLVSDREMVATYIYDWSTEPHNGYVVVSRSTDGGETWSSERRILKEKPESTTYSMPTTRLSDGTFLGIGQMNHFDADHPVTLNVETYGHVPSRLFLARSSDDGRSWVGPEYFEPPLEGPSWEVCHPVLELSDGRLLIPTATWRGWDGESPSGEQTVAFISDDRGKTWPRHGVIFDGRESGLTHWEKSVVQLDDSRILAVAWVYDTAKGQTYPSAYAISEDRGETFSPPRETGFMAQTCKIVQLRDGRILAVYRRHDEPGLWAGLARLDGDRWVNLADAVVWQGADSGMAGSRGAQELIELKFGYPSSAQLLSGDVLTLFWCEEDGAMQIRWTRLGVGG